MARQKRAEKAKIWVSFHWKVVLTLLSVSLILNVTLFSISFYYYNQSNSFEQQSSYQYAEYLKNQIAALSNTNLQFNSTTIRLLANNSILVREIIGLRNNLTQVQGQLAQVQAQRDQIQAQLTQLRAQNSQLQDQNTQYQATIQNLNSQIAQLQTRANQLQAQVSQLESQITQLQTKLKYAYVIVTGDVTLTYGTIPFEIQFLNSSFSVKAHLESGKYYVVLPNNSTYTIVINYQLGTGSSQCSPPQFPLFVASTTYVKSFSC